MAEAISAIITIQEVVDNVKNDLVLYSEEEDVRLKQFAIRAVKQLNLYHGETFKKGTFIINPNLNIVQLPEDYITYITEPYICYSGKKWTLTKDNDMCVPDTQECAEDTNPSADSTMRSYHGFHYGIVGGVNRAYYKIDKTDRKIIIRGSVPDNTFYMDYVAIDLGINGESYLPAETLEMLLAFVHWKRIEHDPGAPGGEKERKRQLYVMEARKYEKLKNSKTRDEILDLIRRGYTQLTKR